MNGVITSINSLINGDIVPICLQVELLWPNFKMDPGSTMNVYHSTYLHAHRVFYIQQNPICTTMFFCKSHLITFYFLSSDLGWKAIWNASKHVAPGKKIHHLETRWRNSHVLDMYWFIMAIHRPFGGCAIYFHYSGLHSPETNSLPFAPWTCLKGNIESGIPSIFRCIFVSLEGMELHNNH